MMAGLAEIKGTLHVALTEQPVNQFKPVTVESQVLSGLEPPPDFYRLLMKGIFDAYVLYPLDNFFERVIGVNTCDFMVCKADNRR